MAIEVVGPAAASLEEGDTRQMHARAISAGGDSVPDAGIAWQRVDTAQGVFTIDSTGLITGLGPGAGLVQARVENLATLPVPVTVTGRPDLVRAAGEQRLVVAAGIAASPAMTVQVVDLTTVPSDTLALAGKPVHFAVVAWPAGADPGASLFLAPGADAGGGEDPLRLVTVTGAGGTASAVVRRVAGIGAPDSVTVAAAALTAVGDTVPGSPVHFVIVFEQN